MKKVLMCGNHPSNKGGMTSVIEQIMEYNWGKEDIDIRFIPTFKPGNIITKSLFFLISYVRICFIILISRPDLIHMHMSYKGSFTRKYMIQRVCKLFGVKNIVHLHGSEFQKWYNTLTERKRKKIRTLIKDADYFIVLGDKWKEIILEIEPCANVRVISNGVKIPKCSVQWKDDECIFLFLGVLIPRKGVADLLEAIKLVHDYVIQKNIRFLIAGTGECEDSLKKRTFELGIDSNVAFLGWTAGDAKKKLLETSQIMVSPSYNEGLPISILEAISYGMPVISTDVGDISSIVIDGKNGVLITPGNILELSRAILKMSDKEVFNKMTKASKEIAKENSIEVFYNKLLQVYVGG